jgi:hypothetical protein
MAETERYVLSNPHPDVEHGVPRQPIECLLTPPDQGLNPDTGLVLIIDGDGFTPASSYNTFLRRYLASRYNCLAVGVFYFGCRLNSLDSVRLQPNPDFFVNLQAAHGIAVSAPATLDADALIRQLCRTLAGQGVTALDRSCWLIRSFEEEYSSFGLLPALDHLQVIGALMQRFPLNPNRFYVMGSSSGGHIAMMMGKLAPQTFSMIVDNSGEIRNPMVQPTRRTFRRGRIAGVECRGLELSPWDEDPASPHHFSEHHRRIRDLAIPEHMGPSPTFRRLYHSVGDPLIPIAERAAYAALAARFGPVSLEGIDAGRLDGTLFKSLEHGMKASLLHLFEDAWRAQQALAARKDDGYTDFCRNARHRFDCGSGIYSLSFSRRGAVELRFEAV